MEKTRIVCILLKGEEKEMGTLANFLLNQIKWLSIICALVLFGGLACS